MGHTKQSVEEKVDKFKVSTVEKKYISEMPVEKDPHHMMFSKLKVYKPSLSPCLVTMYIE